MSKENRANPAEILLAREKGQLLPGWLFSLFVYDLRNDRPSKFAFIVSATVDKRATKRNRAKRLLHEATASCLKEIKPGQIIVFLAKRNIIGKDLKIIQLEVKKLLEKGKVVRKDG